MRFSGLPCSALSTGFDYVCDSWKNVSLLPPAQRGPPCPNACWALCGGHHARPWGCPLPCVQRASACKRPSGGRPRLFPAFSGVKIAPMSRASSPAGLIKGDDRKHSHPSDVASNAESHKWFVLSGHWRDERQAINSQIKVSHHSARQPAHADYSKIKKTKQKKKKRKDKSSQKGVFILSLI